VLQETQEVPVPLALLVRLALFRGQLGRQELPAIRVLLDRLEALAIPELLASRDRRELDQRGQQVLREALERLAPPGHSVPKALELPDQPVTLAPKAQLQQPEQLELPGLLGRPDPQVTPVQPEQPLTREQQEQQDLQDRQVLLGLLGLQVLLLTQELRDLQARLGQQACSAQLGQLVSPGRLAQLVE